MKVRYILVEGFPGYRVGDDGSVWSKWRKGSTKMSKKWRKLKPTGYPYPQVGLTRGGRIYLRKVHRLVLEAFVGPRPPGMECCHYPDRDTRNNALINIRWGTPKQNGEDRVRHGTARTRPLLGEENGAAKLTTEEVIEIRTRFLKGEAPISIAKDFPQVKRIAIWSIATGKSWKHITQKLKVKK